jgi:hypothetical protein
MPTLAVMFECLNGIEGFCPRMRLAFRFEASSVGLANATLGVH